MEEIEKIYYPEGHKLAGQVKEDPECYYLLRIGSNKVQPRDRYIIFCEQGERELTIDALLNKYIREVDAAEISDQDRPKLRSVQELISKKGVQMKSEKLSQKIEMYDLVKEHIHYDLTGDEVYNLIGIVLSVPGQGGR